MNDICTDNRFEVIAEYKQKLIEGTNIDTSPKEMEVLDNILFRIWQMGWIPQIDVDKVRADERQKCMNETKMFIEKHSVEIGEEQGIQKFTEWCKTRGYICYNWQRLIAEYKKEQKHGIQRSQRILRSRRKETGNHRRT